MADITMCDDSACPSFEKCYRAQAPTNPFYQSYFMVSPRMADDSCNEFEPITARPYDDE